MFKDYYLLLCIGQDAKQNEIVQAYNSACDNLEKTLIDKEELDEAYAVLSNQEIRAMYDEELANYNESGDFEEYKIKNKKFVKAMRSLNNNGGNQNFFLSLLSKMTKALLWLIALLIALIFAFAFPPLMKQMGRQSIRSANTYVIPEIQMNYV